MTCRVLVILFAITTLPDGATAAPGQVSRHAASAPADRAKPPDQTSEYWLSPEVIEERLKAVADAKAREYGLSDTQRTQLEQSLLKRWPKFVRTHEDQLKPLVNEFLEARLAPEPPDTEQVADWARRAIPTWELFEKEMAAGDKEIERILTTPQRRRFLEDRSKTSARIQTVRRTLHEWAEGRFEPPESRRRDAETPPPGAALTARERAEPDSPPPTIQEIDQELASWHLFFAEFCESHRLDRTQRTAAESILKEVLERAQAYRARRRAEIERLERMIARHDSADKEAVAEQLDDLYGPIDDMFQELERRLEALPTPAQERLAHTTAGASQPSSRPEYQPETPAEEP